MTSKWHYHSLTSEEQALETGLAERYAGTPPVSQLLVQRGITTLEEADRFFNPSLSGLHDPFLMPGMDKAVGNRIFSCDICRHTCCGLYIVLFCART